MNKRWIMNSRLHAPVLTRLMLHDGVFLGNGYGPSKGFFQFVEFSRFIVTAILSRHIPCTLFVNCQPFVLSQLSSRNLYPLLASPRAIQHQTKATLCSCLPTTRKYSGPYGQTLIVLCSNGLLFGFDF